MTDFIIKKLPYDLTSNAGLALVHPVIHKSPLGSLTPEVTTKKDGKAGFLASFDLYSCSNSWFARLGHLRKNNLSCCFKNEKRCV